MSTDEIRRMLDYPDDGFVVDIVAVRERAHQHQARRRRLGAIGVIGAACAVAVATAVTIGPLTGSAPRTVLVTPSDGGTTSPTSQAPATSSPSPTVSSPDLSSTPKSTSATAATAATRAATVIKAAGATHVPMGQGWLVWVNANRELCRSAPSDTPGGHRYQPDGCRSTTDGNIAGVNVQASGSLTGSMYSAVIPYARARVDVVIDGKRLHADTVRFDRVQDWTFYYLWVPISVADPNSRHVRVIAYDRNGTELGRIGDP